MAECERLEIGMTLSPHQAAFSAIQTPALIVDRAALGANIDRMAARARQAGLALRPHAKTHKSKDIAALQLKAGAIGIACATIAEAEMLAAAGIPGILITTSVVGAAKQARVAKLNREADIAVVVDHIQQVDEVLAALRPGDPPMRLVIDVDVGHARTGVTDLALGTSLAQAIAARSELRFAGIQGFAGHAQHIAAAPERKAAAASAATILRTFADALTVQGLKPELVTGSGTGAYNYDLAGPYNELQVGSYVFMDSDYARIVDEDGKSPSFAISLFVLATVVSVNRAGQVSVDAGTKALATNGPPPCVIIGAPAGSTYRFAGDEHGIITIPAGAPSPSLGARMLIGATHCDPTVNLHSSYHVVTEGDVEKWPIVGRY